MKKLLASLILLFALTGCGDDVTNINGYTDAEVKAMIDSTLDAQEVVVMNDTVYQQTVDTIYNMVIDTVTHELVDTIYQRVVDTVYNDLVDTIYTRVVDTVMNELVDTIYQRVVDTVYHELVDTIYQKVIDTVFTELERVGIDVSKPRDTSIIVYDTSANNMITMRLYKGIVFKDVFYDTTKYEFQYKKGGNFAGYNYINIVENNGQNFSEAQIKYISSGSPSLFETNLWVTNACGVIDEPIVTPITYNTRDPKRFKGFHIANETDLVVLGSNIGNYIDETIKIYAGIDGNVYHYTNKSGVILSGSSRPTHYLCAYDLK